MNPGTAFEMAVPRQPDLLEIVLGSLPHFEAIHGNEHARSPSVTRPRIAEKARISRAFARIGTNPPATIDRRQ